MVGRVGFGVQQRREREGKECWAEFEDAQDVKRVRVPNDEGHEKRSGLRADSPGRKEMVLGEEGKLTQS